MNFTSKLTFVFCILLFSYCNAVKDYCSDANYDYLFPCSSANFNEMLNNISKNNIFKESENISIPYYSYNDEDQKWYSSSGDESIDNLIETNTCCDARPYISIFSNKPTLKWTAFQSNLMAVAIFDKPIRMSIDGKKIQNTEDVVWTWNSGMGTGSQISGNIVVRFVDGKDVIESQIQTTTTALMSNKIFYWAVWAWDQNGINITHSSRAIPFIVKGFKSILIESPLQIEGNWLLKSAINDNTGDDETLDFPIQSFWSDFRCPDADLLIRTSPNNIVEVFEFDPLRVPNIDETAPFPPLTFSLEGIVFDELMLLDDCIFIGKAKYNGVDYIIRYERG